MKQLYFIVFLSAGAITSMYGADNLPKEAFSLNGEGSFYGQMLQDHPSYDFVGMQGDTDSAEHTIGVRKKGHEDEWSRYRYFTTCTFNKWGKLIDHHDQDGAGHASGFVESNKEECKNLQELYNKFDTMYQARLALNRKERRAELTQVEAKLAQAEEDLIAAKIEERRANDRVNHWIAMYRKLQNSLPN